MTRRPRVLITTDAVGGIWTYALDLADGLEQAGVTAILVALGPAPSRAQREAARERGIAVERLDGPLDWTARSTAPLRRQASALGRLVESLQADLLHLNSPSLAAFGGFGVPVLGACHSCLATWWAGVKHGALPMHLAWRRDLLARGYAACDGLIAPTRAFAVATAAEYGVEPGVVLNGRARPPGHAPHRARPNMVLTAGRLWDEGKNVATLGKAACLLRAPFYALGPLAPPHGPAVSFPGLNSIGRQAPQDVARWMGDTRVFASAALYEPFGLAVLEAAQAGAALVLSDIASFRELWGEAGIFVDPLDAAGVAAAIERLLQDEDAWHGASAAAMRVAARYSVAAMTAGTLAHYARLSPAAFGPRRLEAAA